jgi:FKBP-type peptidyl-prolyl cis-trans isomerase
MRFPVALIVALALGTTAAGAAVSSLSQEANAKFLADNGAQKGVVTRPSGLQYRILHNGFGKRPHPTDIVSVYYTGTLINGSVFDGTEPGLPAQFKCTDLIPGWTEALLLMREGDKWHIVIPSNLAYGARGAGNGAIPPNQTLTFDLELISVTPPKEQPPEAPDTSTGH